MGQAVVAGLTWLLPMTVFCWLLMLSLQTTQAAALEMPLLRTCACGHGRGLRTRATEALAWTPLNLFRFSEDRAETD